MEHKLIDDDKEHAFCGQNKMNIFRWHKRFCDFIIKIESEEIPVHRNVICLHSDFFNVMLTDMYNTIEKLNGVVELKDVSRDAVVKCIDYMYTGQTCVLETCDLEMCVVKCGELLHVATMFQLHKLCKIIAEFLEEKLDCTSFFLTRKVADIYNCRKLLDACNDFAIKNFQQIAQLEEFNHLEKKYIQFLVGLKNTEVYIPDGAKCKAVIAWTKQDSSNRVAFLPEFLEKIDMMKLPPSYKRFLFENEPLIHSCMRPVCLSVFEEFGVEKKDFEWEKPRTRFGIGVFDRITAALQYYDVDAKKWTQKQKFNNDITAASKAEEFSAVVLDQHLYVFLDNKAVYRIVYSDPGATWEKKANKYLPPGPAVVLKGFIYTTGSEDTGDVEQYDPAADSWNILPETTIRVMGAALAISKGELFSIAGYDDDFTVETEIFNPGSSTWRMDNPLNVPRYLASAATFEEGIYVMGGYCGDYGFDHVEYRCPASQTWTVLKSMLNPRSRFNSFHFGGKILAVGGDDSRFGEDFRERTDTQTIEEYDIETKEWKIIERMEGKDIQSQASISWLVA